MEKNLEIHFRVSEAEYEMIKKKMELTKIQNLSAYLIKMAIDGNVFNLEIPEMKELLTMLGRYSNNLNQIAKRLNESKSIYAEDIKDMQEKQNEIYKMTKVLYLKLLNL